MSTKKRRRMRQALGAKESARTTPQPKSPAPKVIRPERKVTGDTVSAPPVPTPTPIAQAKRERRVREKPRTIKRAAKTSNTRTVEPTE